MADLVVKDLTVEYSTGDYVIRPIDRFNVKASTGELVVLLGPSGSGKTTLLSCLAGILTPTAGSVRVGETDVTALRREDLARYRRHTVGIVFQAFNLIPSLSALENVEAPLRLGRMPRRQARDRARALLERVGLADRIGHRPGDLSGGQQQRVAIARALAFDPPVLVADEPTAHLDYVQVETVLRLLRDLAAPGRLVVVATHDERMLPLADRVVELAPRAASAERPPERVALAKGEVLFEMGSRGDLIYVVEDGLVDLYRTRPDGSELLLTITGPGEHFGELGPLLGLPRSASARARADTTLIGYTVREFRERSESGRLPLPPVSPPGSVSSAKPGPDSPAPSKDPKPARTTPG